MTQVLILHSTPTALGVRNASPFCLKAETLLRLAGVAFEKRVSDPRSGPRQKLPYLELPDGSVIADSRNIQRHLEERGLLRLVPGPDDLLVRRLVEDHLYWIQVAFRWNHHPEAVRDAFFAPVPRAFRGLVFGLVRKQVRAALHAQGTGRRPEDEQLALAREDLTTLETVLGTRRFFGGDEPSVADASVHGLTSQLLATHLDDPLTQLAGTFSGLVAHHRRVEAAVYAEAPVRDAEAA